MAGSTSRRSLDLEEHHQMWRTNNCGAWMTTRRVGEYVLE
jgi:hypothetical protein